MCVRPIYLYRRSQTRCPVCVQKQTLVLLAILSAFICRWADMKISWPPKPCFSHQSIRSSTPVRLYRQTNVDGGVLDVDFMVQKYIISVGQAKRTTTRTLLTGEQNIFLHGGGTFAGRPLKNARRPRDGVVAVSSLLLRPTKDPTKRILSGRRDRVFRFVWRV